ncbi:DNA polymerase III subunit chi [Melaminivora alkalimesophila]|uniref:DNA polymerase III chi subunit n=1 Tax=Melaminivora alkalimesophila TaxID=1165852 RepID=A0A317RDC8_9BURK|nr:DNA polymerase III subunit chi [Melaminivora alkalimesophila]PWW46344.1 DNA polymerase III chi subunit [Melaminivora alkalimesophila]
MTEVAFHLNVADRRHHVCRLARKAWRQGARVFIAGPAAELEALDRMLWALEPWEFLPHCLADAPAPVLDASPIVLGTQAAAAPWREVLVNLGPQVPEAFAEFARVIEVVPAEEGEERERARERWRVYQAAGHLPVPHDLGVRRSGG